MSRPEVPDAVGIFPQRNHTGATARSAGVLDCDSFLKAKLSI